MLNKFTERARRVLLIAQQEAMRLGHDYIGTEHILLGLMQEREGIAAKVLAAQIDIDSVRQEIEQVIGHGNATSQDIGYTPRSKKVLELALEEAMQLGHNYIGTEHILLGLVREGEGVAGQILAQLGIDIDAVRQRTIELVSGITMQGQSLQTKGSQGLAPSLKEFGRDLNQLAEEGKIDPVIGR
ncbi:MAG: ATP-dependent Clp protease ATP-binding subunit ClpC, partial [Pelosinus sp.]|nr:ATP-dependent Clp protease ATP-binding subunit ClpC [Pelosinus sp.]